MEQESTEQKKQIFRQSSLDRVNSPDQLNEYLRVTNPAIWVLLAAIIVLLAGFCVWGIFGRLDTVVTLGAHAQGGTVTCYVSSSEVSSVEVGMNVTVADADYKVEEISSSAMPAEDLSENLRSIGELEDGEYVYSMELSGDRLEDGYYAAEIVTDSVAPMSFIMDSDTE